MSARPGRSLLPRARRVVRRARFLPGAVVAVVDDPPGTGSAYRKTCSVLRATGVPTPMTTLLVPLFGDVAPASLEGMAAVTLPFDRWAVHARLEPLEVARCWSGAGAGGWRAVEVRGVGQGLPTVHGFDAGLLYGEAPVAAQARPVTGPGTPGPATSRRGPPR